jgi:hypothetical protein
MSKMGMMPMTEMVVLQKSVHNLRMTDTEREEREIWETLTGRQG